MRNMSFFHTQQQIRDRSKTVTRRLGWQNLKPGTILRACVKCQGLKKGERLQVLGEIKVLDVHRERLDEITRLGCYWEGFPNLSPAGFVEMFCKAMGCKPSDQVTVIEFAYHNICWACGRGDQKTFPVVGQQNLRICEKCDKATERSKPAAIGQAIADFNSGVTLANIRASKE